jgi:CDGSH-type Zn-finger protein
VVEVAVCGCNFLEPQPFCDGEVERVVGEETVLALQFESTSTVAP